LTLPLAPQCSSSFLAIVFERWEDHLLTPILIPKSLHLSHTIRFPRDQLPPAHPEPPPAVQAMEYWQMDLMLAKQTSEGPCPDPSMVSSEFVLAKKSSVAAHSNFQRLSVAQV
jgi:hypothetical protein